MEKNNVENKKKIDTEANSAGYNLVITVFAILAIVAFVQKLLTGDTFADISILLSASLVGGVGESYVRYKHNKNKGNMSILIVSTIGVVFCLGLVLYEGIFLK